MRDVSPIRPQEGASPAPDAVYGDGDIDVGGVGKALWRRKHVIAAVTLLSLLGSAAFVTLVKPRYTAEVKALVESQESFFTRPGQEKSNQDGSVLAADPEAVGSQALVVASRDLAREAIKALNLRSNPEFSGASSGIPVIGPLVSMLSAPPREAQTDDAIMDAYFDRLNVFPVARSRVLQIEFWSRDPDFAARAANTIADLYLGVQSSQKRASAGLAANSLAGLIAELRTKVTDADRRAEEFRAVNGLLQGANNLSMGGQQIADISTQLGAARSSQAESQAKSRIIREMLRQGRIGEVPDVANNELIRRLSEQRATLRSQISAEGRTLLPGHPRIKELTAQLVEIEGAIRTQAEKVARTLENDAKITSQRVANLVGAIDEQKKSVGGSSAEEARAKELDREARLLKEQLEASTTKYQEALARQAADSTPSDARIISRAMAPNVPSFPKKLPIIIFATLAALLLSSGFVIAGELLSGRAYTPAASGQGRVEPQLEEQRSEAHAYPGFGGDDSRFSDAPAQEPMPQRPAARHARASLRTFVDFETPAPGRSSDSFRETAPSSFAQDALAINAGNSVEGLASRLSEHSRAGIALRVLVCGASQNAGAAATAVALGRVVASDRRAILVEVDGRPGADAHGPAGLGEWLAGNGSFEDVIHRDRDSKLHLLPSGRASYSASADIDALIEALARTYEYVIVCAAGEPSEAALAPLVAQAHTCVLVCAPIGEEALNDAACQDLLDAGAVEVLAITPEVQPHQPTTRQGATAA